ncbi:MAG: CHAT domain-containing protein, partial [Coleofasciculus sp.]
TIKHPQLEAKAWDNLSQIYNQQGDHTLALDAANKVGEIAKALDDPNLERNALDQLGSIYKSQGNYEKSLELAQQLLTLIRQNQLNDFEITALTKLSSNYLWLGNTEKAIEYGKEALALAQQRQVPGEEQIALTGLAQIHSQRGEYEQAVELAQRSLDISQRTKNFFVEVATSKVLSEAYAALGDYQNVISVAEPGLARSRKLNDRYSEAELLINLGSAYNLIGEYSKGKELIEQGLTIGRELQNPVLEWLGLAKLGNVYRSLKDYQNALELYQKSLKIAQDNNSPRFQPLPLTLLGIAYSELGDYQTSSEYLQQALPILRTLQNRHDESIVLTMIALNYFAQGEAEKTLDFAQQGLVIAQEIKQPVLEIMANEVLSIGYAELGDDQKAMESAQAILAFTRNVQNLTLERAALNLIGSLHRKFGRKQEAIAIYQQALAINTLEEVIGDKSYSYAGLGRVYAELDQPNIAITYYKQAINDFEEIRRINQELPPQLQESALQAIIDFDGLTTADIYRQLADLLLSQGRDKEAYQVLELLKIQEIRDLARGTVSTDDQPDVLLSEAEKKVQAESQSLIALGRQINECERTNCTEKSELNDRLTVLIREFNQNLKTIEKEIRSNRATDDLFFDPRKLAKAREIVEAQPHTVLIYPLVLEERLWLIMFSEGGVVHKQEVNIGEEELGETVNQFRRLLENNRSDIAEIKETGKQLYDWLVKPFAAELKQNQVQNLVFALDRVTRYIPMSALSDGENYLIENYTISTVFSADLTNIGARLPVDIQDIPVLAMGVSDAVGGFSSLPYVQTELNAIVRQTTDDDLGIYPGKTFLNDTFDYRSLRDNLTGHKILHLATHGVFVPGSADDSFLLLGDGEQLRISDIQTLTQLQDIHLVVLSACETTLAGSRPDGVEIASVAYYFLSNGADAVMASLWKVNDASTSLKMRQFYNNLAQGTEQNSVTKAEALRQAQLALLRGNFSVEDIERAGLLLQSPEGLPASVTTNLNHPYYWAPFILIGNGL